MRDDECVAFLQWALPRLRLRWPGFRKVRRQVCKRLRRRLEELGLPAIEPYRARLEADAREWGVLDGLCRITISRFYRDRHVFDLLGAAILPELATAARLQGRPVRCWCAGCASGEEVYTLKILWDAEVRPRIGPIGLEVIGTDADEALLRRAERGCYARGSMRDAPPRWPGLAFTRQGDLYCVRALHCDGVVFLRQDIRSELPAGPLDLVLCRNLVFTYFEPGLQRSVLQRIEGLLRDGAYLVIGAHEQLPDASGAFRQVAGCREILRKARADDVSKDAKTR
jgi:chemotaxis protein methyltransferase CheR